MKVEDIALDDIEKNSWNPNQMPEEAFNRLVKEIDTVGFIELPQVVPLASGKYRILGGEHRIEACRVLGRTHVPAVVLTEAKWQDEDLQKFVTVRLNVLKGKLNPERMAALYDEMAKKYGDDALQDMFSYTDASAWQKTLDAIKRGLKDAGMPKKIRNKLDQAKDMRSLEDLSTILNQMFTSYGDTVDKSYMVFTFGKQEHIYVAMDKNLKGVMHRATKYTRDEGKDMAEFLGAAIAAALKNAPRSAKKAEESAVLAEDETPF